MRYHTLAFTSVLGYIAKRQQYLERARYQFRVTMEFTKTSPSKRTGTERGSYYVKVDLSSAEPRDWRIEDVRVDRPDIKVTHYPELKEFKFSTDGSSQIRVDHSRAKEHDIEIKSDNRRYVRVNYQGTNGSGYADGDFTSEFDQLTITDNGPTPPPVETARIEAVIRFDQVMKL